MAATSHRLCGMVIAMLENLPMDGVRRRTDRLADDPDRLWTYAEFAEWANVSERTAREWVAKGVGPAVLVLGRYRRIRVRDALAWLDGRYRQESA